MVAIYGPSTFTVQCYKELSQFHALLEFTVRVFDF